MLEGRLDEEVDHKKNVQVEHLKLNCTNTELYQLNVQSNLIPQVELENARTLERSSNLWSSLEESGWHCSMVSTT